MAQKKKTAKKRSKKTITYTAQRSNPARGRTAQVRAENTALRKEIAIILVALVSIILFLGVLNLAGEFGKWLRNLQLGTFGVLGYVFPFFLGFIIIYLILRVPADGWRAVLRSLGMILIFISLSGIAALIKRTGIGTYDAEDFYDLGIKGSGGGIVGGGFASLLAPAIGRVGAYFILVFLTLICFVLITGRSVISPLLSGVSRIRERSEEERDYRQESRALRNEERNLRRAEQREEKLEARREAVRRLDRKVSGVENIDMAGQEKYSDYKHGVLPSSVSRRGKKGEPEKIKNEVPLPSGVLTDPAEPQLRIHGLADEMQAPFDENAQPLSNGPIFLNRDYRSSDELARIDAAGGLVDLESAPDEQESSGESFIPAADVKAPDYDMIHASSPKDSHIDVPETMIDAGSAAAVDESPRGHDAPAVDSIWSDGGYRESSSGAVFSEGQSPLARRRPKIRRSYKLPPLTLLEKSEKSVGVNNTELKSVAATLEDTLRNFGVGAKVTDISCGPTVTRYELHPDQGVKISRIVALTNDIKLSLAATDIRIEAPIPGKAAVGIEVPNSENVTVHIRDVLATDKFKNAKSILSFAVGKDIGGDPVVGDISKMPHLLIAGATNSGKSVCINSIIVSLLYRATPEEVKLIMIDPKQVELKPYVGIPHLMIPIVTDVKKAAGALNWAIAEMEQRYKRFADMGVRDINGFNEKIVSMQEEYDMEDEHDEDDERPEKLCRIVIIVDEMADLMMTSPREVEDAICRLAQLARAAGIHLVLATQRPSVNVITGLIKANIPSRIAFAVSSSIDSRIIIDSPGAEKLLGKGDMLYFPIGTPKPVRVQGTFVSDGEIEKIADFWINQQDEATMARQRSMDQEVDAKAGKAGGGADAAAGGGDDNDELFADCGRFIIENDKGSIGNLQRRFKIGFNRAARIMDALADAGVVGPDEGKKPREILMTIEEFEDYLKNM
ncbi:MAG: DNA translocase FtsK [Lachnospiraceae bacterium]|nr:DNA translocase FtsK [Lachnospiraceae bacterium]